MPFIRETTIFQVTTAPTNLARAIPHTGGWTESVWYFLGTSKDAELNLLRQKRAVLLPKQAKIIGYRRAQYNLTSGRLVPLGAASGTLNYVGNPSYNTDLPQVALEIDFGNLTFPNTSRQVLRCIPDAFMLFGEYQPDAPFAAAITAYCNAMSTNAAFSFIGRDLSLAPVRVLSIVGAVITVDVLPAGLAVDEDVRLLHVTSSTGLPITGRFRVVAFAGNTITVTPAPGGAVSVPSGLLRRDRLSPFSIQEYEVKRARVKKIGRPSEGYRGRRSKVRA